MYKAVFNDNYLCHYNKNHSKANGQFVSGDGDGDGISNDHANQNKKKGLTKKQKVRLGVGIATSVVGTAALIAGAAFIKDKMDGKDLQESWNKKAAEAKAKQYVQYQRQKVFDERMKKWSETNKRQMDSIENRMYGGTKSRKRLGDWNPFEVSKTDYKPKGLSYELETVKRWHNEGQRQKRR